jgi:hypothetical protein
MANVDIRLSDYYQSNPSPLTVSPPTTREAGLFGDLELLASLSPEIDRDELARKDERRKAGEYLRSKLHGTPLTPFQARLLATVVEEDFEARETLKHQKPDEIVPKGVSFSKGSWRLRKQVDGKRVEKYFPTLDLAKGYLAKASGEAPNLQMGGV